MGDVPSGSRDAARAFYVERAGGGYNAEIAGLLNPDAVDSTHASAAALAAAKGKTVGRVILCEDEWTKTRKFSIYTGSGQFVDSITEAYEPA